MPLTTRRVLIVDDEPMVLKIADRVLSREGVEVLTADSGQSALSGMEQHPEVLMVLLDSNLPDMNAEQVLELMRGRGLNIPVVLSSGHGTEGLPTERDFANIRGYLPKPYSVSQLSAMVRSVLEGSRG